MAQITKEQLLAISEDFEKVYQDMVDELLINIAKHFSDPNNQRTMFWEVQKLSELGALTEESRDIIAKRANVIPDLVEQKFWEVAKEANKDINPQLKEALKKGILPGTFKDMEASPAITQLLEEYVKQANNTMNLVNTTMLQSTLQAYSQVVQDITYYEQQMQNAQSILNVASGMLTTNQTTRQGAFKWALDKMADEGITGFTDRLGRHWNAESYVAMVIRTTAHNVAINSVKERMNEYGSDIFQVSAHSGCRPSHYKFQNKFYSWSSPAGTFEDGLGRKHKYENITDVSADDKYGSTYPSAGGIFGINCSHYPIPIIPGLSIPRERNVQSKAESDKEYALSQEQRALERKIREQKRQLEIDKASGMSDEIIKRDKQAIQDSQAQMRQFIKETGRARRYDREGITIASGGNIAKQNKKDKEESLTKTIRNAKSLEDIENYYGGKIRISDDVKRLDFEAVRGNIASFDDVLQQYPEAIDLVRNIEVLNQGLMATNGHDLFFNGKSFTNIDGLKKAVERGVSNGWFSKNVNYTTLGSHEAGHVLEWLLINLNSENSKWDFVKVAEWNKHTEAKKIVSQAVKNIKKTPFGRNDDGKIRLKRDLIESISRYALTNDAETLAEACQDVYVNNEKANPLSLEIMKLYHEVYLEYKGGA